MLPDKIQACIFWFRRDLRLEDNRGFFEALNNFEIVIPLFIFDEDILENLPENDKRVSFLHDTLSSMDQALKEKRSGLWVLYGKPKDIFKEVKVSAVYCNNDYEPYARERDSEVEDILSEKGIEFKQFKDQVLFEKKEILKKDGSPYTIFTPYSKKWREHFNPKNLKPLNAQFENLIKKDSPPLPPLAKMGFKKVQYLLKPVNLHRDQVANYHNTRNIPAKDGTTNLSVSLRFGLISVREAIRSALPDQSLTNEIIWREFYSMILFNFPRVVNENFKKKYNNINWRNQSDDFMAWCSGKTGYPMVDAGMRELNETGYMHNRVRMITAGFLTKHLLIHWSWGESYFASKLMDYDLASNNGNWQWVAGTGCDAAPYFRVFNPKTQQQKFDKNESYIRKWIPEYGTSRYSSPMVDHKMARQRALDAFKLGLG